METRYLYRGTTIGWPGNPTLRDRRITCTTTDPLVATLFGIECRNHGNAVIVAAWRDPLERSIDADNWLDIIECSVNLRLLPLEFQDQAEFYLEVDSAIMILKELGFTDLPARLRDKSILQQEIAETHALGMRLNAEQIRRFNLRMQEIGHGRERP